MWNNNNNDNDKNSLDWNTLTATAEPFSYNFPTNASCVNWNQYYTNCSQLGGNPFQSTISFDNIGMVTIFPYFFLCSNISSFHAERKRPKNVLYKICSARFFFHLIKFFLLSSTFRKAWVAIFLVISLEGWTDIMYYVQDAHSFWDWIYFVLLIVVNGLYQSIVRFVWYL